MWYKGHLLMRVETQEIKWCGSHVPVVDAKAVCRPVNWRRRDAITGHLVGRGRTRL
jgi:hypothetical protein